MWCVVHVVMSNIKSTVCVMLCFVVDTAKVASWMAGCSSSSQKALQRCSHTVRVSLVVLNLTCIILVVIQQSLLGIFLKFLNYCRAAICCQDCPCHTAKTSSMQPQQERRFIWSLERLLPLWKLCAQPQHAKMHSSSHLPTLPCLHMST